MRLLTFTLYVRQTIYFQGTPVEIIAQSGLTGKLGFGRLLVYFAFLIKNKKNPSQLACLPQNMDCGS